MVIAMLSVILIWCYMLFTMGAIGTVFMTCVSKKADYQVKHIDTCLLCGMVCVTIYAQFFSLFYKVGLAANIVMLFVSIGCLYRYRLKAAGCLIGLRDNIIRNKEGKRGRILTVIFLFLLFAYGTSRGIIHYDTGLYHAQSIRWIEEYGVVKGLGNLHCRLAYNSASFALSALYSMAFLGGQSYHCAAGFLAFLLAKVCMEITDSFRKRTLYIADFARVMGIYYLVNIYDEMISPASDYFMVLLAFYVIIRFLDLLEGRDGKEKNVLPYALLGVMGVFLLTVKLSAALILLLVLYPAYYLVREKRFRETAGYLLLGILTALPYFIRNVIISGWLVYPFTQIDFFQVAWKISIGLADYDAREIQVWGRGYRDVNQYDLPIKEWLPGWFRQLAGSDKVFVLLGFIAVAVLVLYAIGMLAGLWRKRWDILLVQGTVAASFLFWLCSSPLIRYGCVYVYLTPAIVFGGIYKALTGEKRGILNRLCLAAVGLLLVYKSVALAKEIVTDYHNDYWLVQKDYDTYETAAYKIEGITFYYPVEGDQTGYESFPSSPTKAQIGFLGNGLQDGFYDAAPLER